MVPFIQEQLDGGQHLNTITRHMMGLFNGCPGGKAFRRHLSDHVHLPSAGVQTLLDAVAHVPEHVGRHGLSAEEEAAYQEPLAARRFERPRPGPGRKGNLFVGKDEEQPKQFPVDAAPGRRRIWAFERGSGEA